MEYLFIYYLEWVLELISTCGKDNRVVPYAQLQGVKSHVACLGS